jgi:hypothetical protein
MLSTLCCLVIFSYLMVGKFFCGKVGHLVTLLWITLDGIKLMIFSIQWQFQNSIDCKGTIWNLGTPFNAWTWWSFMSMKKRIIFTEIGWTIKFIMLQFIYCKDFTLSMWKYSFTHHLPHNTQPSLLYLCFSILSHKSNVINSCLWLNDQGYEFSEGIW